MICGRLVSTAPIKMETIAAVSVGGLGAVQCTHQSAALNNK